MAIWQHNKRVLGLFSLRMRRNAYLRASGQKSDLTPKMHFLTRNDVIWRILRKYPSRGVGCSLIEEPKKRTYQSPQMHEKSRIWGTETPEPIATKFCMPGAVQDVITSANFCEDRLRGFGVASGRILAFSIDLLRLL